MQSLICLCKILISYGFARFCRDECSYFTEGQEFVPRLTFKEQTGDKTLENICKCTENMGHRTKRFFQWSGKMGERLWEPKGLGVVWKMGWIFRSGFFLYMGLHLLYVWGAFLRISGRLLYIGLADGAKTAWKGFVFGCVAVLWLGWWIFLCDGVNGCVAVFLCLFSNMMTWNYSK